MLFLSINFIDRKIHCKWRWHNSYIWRTFIPNRYTCTHPPLLVPLVSFGLIFVSENSSSWNIPSLKKYSYILASFLAFFSFHGDSGYAASIKQEFIVTAYYSPLPDQNFYLKGNYEAEKILNGNGTNGASGKPVFIGMIAAPKTYNFGTRIDSCCWCCWGDCGCINSGSALM